MPGLVGARRVFHSARWSMTARLASTGLKFLTVPIFARLLEPAEFGVVAVSMTIVVFATIFGGAGLASWLVIAKDEDPVAVDTAFWSCTVSAVLFGGLVFLLSEPLAGLLGAPEASPILAVLAALLPLTLIAGLPTALLSRRMQFDRLAWNDIAGEGIGTAAAIAAAFAGWGAWALVVQLFVSATVKLPLLMLHARYRPRLHFSLERLRAMLGYSSQVVLADLFFFLTFQSPTVVITRLVGLSAAGIHSVANRFAELPIQVVQIGIMNVLFPTFATMAEDLPRRTQALLRSTRFTTALLTPMMFGMWAVSEPLMSVVFGVRWADSWQILGLMALSKGILIPCACFIPFLKGVARSDILWMTGLGRAVLVIAATTVGALTYGLIGACVALAGVSVVVLLGYSLVVFRTAGIGFFDGCRSFIGPYLSAIVMAVGVRAFLDHTGTVIEGNVERLALGITMGVFVYATLALLLHRDLLATALLMMRKASARPEQT